MRVSRNVLVMILVTLACLAAVEATVRPPSFWTREQNSLTGIVEPMVGSALSRAPDSRLVFLGDSRIQYAISPLVISESLGLPHTSVANLGIPDGTPFDYLAIYREHRPSLRNAQVMALNLSARDFNWERWGSEGGARNRFRQRASLAQRASVPNWRDKIDLTVGWAWKTWDTRYLSYGYARKGVLELAGAPPSAESEWRNHFTIDELERAVLPEEISQTAHGTNLDLLIDYPYDFDFYHYRFSQVQLDALAELVSLARKDGLDIILLETPVAPLTQREITESFRPEDALWRVRVKDATGLPVHRLPLHDIRCADWKDCYVDEAHLNVTGARAYSESVGKWLRHQLSELSFRRPSEEVAGQ